MYKKLVNHQIMFRIRKQHKVTFYLRSNNLACRICLQTKHLGWEDYLLFMHTKISVYNVNHLVNILMVIFK